MASSVDVKTCVVVPNWNGRDTLPACLDSLLAQAEPATIIVVENGSADGSLELLKQNYQQVELVVNSENLGFAGGVNGGIRKAMELGATYVALFNNDAVADKNWLSELVKHLDSNQEVGIATCKLMDSDRKLLDSTGESYTVWGLPYPRGRGESDLSKYDLQTEVFGASGGASLYRIKMLEEIGLFDEDFFAYYEDVDVSFRAQLAGWKVRYVPQAVAYHQIGATSGKLKGFTTYQTMKNQPLLLWKNVPRKFLWHIGWRFTLAHTLFFLRAIARGEGWIALKGDLWGTGLLFKKSGERRHIQESKKASDDYVWNILVHDLPPNAHALHKLRSTWWKLWGRHE